VDNFLCRSLWGSSAIGFSFKPSVGASGGILTLWDTLEVDIWFPMSYDSCFVVKGRLVKSNLDFSLVNVYAPCDNEERQVLIPCYLRSWHRDHTQNLDSKICGVKDCMSALDIKEDGEGLEDEEIEELHLLSADIMAFSKSQASMQWQKSRITWLNEGDANTKFFHGVMSSRRRSNVIVSIYVDGEQIEGVQEVRNDDFDHFSRHFKRVDVERPCLRKMVVKSLSNEEGADLIKPFLLDEIKETMWDYDSFKSPGPDGINLGFFKRFLGYDEGGVLEFLC